MRVVNLSSPPAQKSSYLATPPQKTIRTAQNTPLRSQALHVSPVARQLFGDANEMFSPPVPETRVAMQNYLDLLHKVCFLEFVEKYRSLMEPVLEALGQLAATRPTDTQFAQAKEALENHLVHIETVCARATQCRPDACLKYLDTHTHDGVKMAENVLAEQGPAYAVALEHLRAASVYKRRFFLSNNDCLKYGPEHIQGNPDARWPTVRLGDWTVLRKKVKRNQDQTMFFGNTKFMSPNFPENVHTSINPSHWPQGKLHVAWDENDWDDQASRFNKVHKIHHAQVDKNNTLKFKDLGGGNSTILKNGLEPFLNHFSPYSLFTCDGHKRRPARVKRYKPKKTS